MGWLGQLFKECFVTEVDDPEYIRAQAERSNMNGKEFHDFCLENGLLCDESVRKLSADDVRELGSSIYGAVSR